MFFVRPCKRSVLSIGPMSFGMYVHVEIEHRRKVACPILEPSRRWILIRRPTVSQPSLTSNAIIEFKCHH